MESVSLLPAPTSSPKRALEAKWQEGEWSLPLLLCQTVDAWMKNYCKNRSNIHITPYAIADAVEQFFKEVCNQ